MTIAFDAVFVGRLESEADAAAVLAAWDRFRDRYGQAVSWQDYGTGKWRGASPTMWRRLADALADEKSRKRIHSYHLHGGDSYDSAVPPAFEMLAATGQLKLRWLPTADLGESGFAEEFQWLAATLPIDWGYGGYGVYGPGYSDATGGRHDPVGDALQAEPLLGMSHPITWGAMHQGVTTLGSVNALGKKLFAQLGGQRCIAALSELGAAPADTGTGVVYSCTGQEHGRALWSLLAPARPEAEFLETMSWIPGLTPDEMVAWVNRFE